MKIDLFAVGIVWSNGIINNQRHDGYSFFRSFSSFTNLRAEAILRQKGQKCEKSLTKTGGACETDDCGGDRFFEISWKK